MNIEILRFEILLFCGSLFSQPESHMFTAAGLKNNQFHTRFPFGRGSESRFDIVTDDVVAQRSGS